MTSEKHDTNINYVPMICLLHCFSRGPINCLSVKYALLSIATTDMIAMSKAEPVPHSPEYGLGISLTNIKFINCCVPNLTHITNTLMIQAFVE